MPIRTLARQELGGGYAHGPKIVVDTSELRQGLFETIAMRPDGTEIELRHTHSEEQALLDFREILMGQAGPIQRAFLQADMRPGERYTLFRIDDLGFPVAQCFTFRALELITYAQHRDAVRLACRLSGRRSDSVLDIFEGSFAICRGWQRLPEDFGFEVTERANGVTVKKSRYTCFEAGFFEDMKAVMKDVLAICENYRTGVNGKLYA